MSIEVTTAIRIYERPVAVSQWVKNAWIFTSTPLKTCLYDMVLKYKDNLTYTFQQSSLYIHEFKMFEVKVKPNYIHILYHLCAREVL
jgi:hypothetical protein